MSHWLFSAVKIRLRKTNETALKSVFRVKILIMKFIENNIWEGTSSVFFEILSSKKVTVT